MPDLNGQCTARLRCSQGDRSNRSILPGRIAWLQLTHHLTGFYRNQLLWAGTLMNLQRTGQKTPFLGTTWPPTVGDDSPLLARWDHLPLLCLPMGGTGCRLQVSLELHWGLSQCWWKSECVWTRPVCTTRRAAHGGKGPNLCLVGAFTRRRVLARPGLSGRYPGVHVDKLTLTIKNCME